MTRHLVFAAFAASGVWLAITDSRAAAVIFAANAITGACLAVRVLRNAALDERDEERARIGDTQA